MLTNSEGTQSDQNKQHTHTRGLVVLEGKKRAHVVFKVWSTVSFCFALYCLFIFISCVCHFNYPYFLNSHPDQPILITTKEQFNNELNWRKIYNVIKRC